MKLHILSKEPVPAGFSLVAVAHASLVAYLNLQDTAEVREWLAGPFSKAVYKVTQARSGIVVLWHARYGAAPQPLCLGDCLGQSLPLVRVATSPSAQ